MGVFCMKTILVLDDEESIQTLLNDILTDEGYRVILSDDGEEVMEILKKEVSLMAAFRKVGVIAFNYYRYDDA